jgi:hypothetical protein
MPDRCDIRDRLEGNYTRAMNRYHGKVSVLLETASDQAADEGTADLYRAAVQARAVLLQHLKEHGCGVPIHKLRARL